MRLRVTALVLLSACAPAAHTDAGLERAAVAREPRSAQATDSPSRRDPFDRLRLGDVPEGTSGLEVNACAECHPQHAEEWKHSGHAQAFVDPLFQQEWSGQAFCSDCHAPRAALPRHEPEAAQAGVDCATCHVRDSVVVSASVSGRAPHRSAEEPERAGVALCSACHQFEFPRVVGLAMQNTVEEWRASGATQGCPGCHMPSRGGHTSHRFPGHRDPTLLARALIVEAEAERDGWSTDVVLRLRANRVGHSVPTGDVFRRLVVRAWVEGREGNAAEVRLARRFDVEGGHWEPTVDERVPPPGHGERVVELRVPDSGSRMLWSVDLWSVSPRLAGRFDQDVTLHSRMATGVIEMRPR